MKRKIIIKVLFLSSILCLTSCSSKTDDAEETFTFDDFIEKYNLDESKTYGTLEDDGYEITFNENCFFFNNESLTFALNEADDITYLEELGTFKYLKDGILNFGSFYGSSEMSASSLEVLLEEIASMTSLPIQKSLSPAKIEFVGNWKNNSRKTNIMSFDKNGKNYGRLNSTSISYTFIEDNYSSASYVIGDTYKLYVNASDSELRFNSIRNDVKFNRKNTTLQDILPVGENQTIPGVNHYEIKIQGGFTNDGKNYFVASFDTYNGNPDFFVDTDFYTYGYNRLNFINSYSNKEPYKTQNSEPYYNLNLFNFMEFGETVSSEPFEVDLTTTIEIMKASGSVLGNNEVTKFGFNTSFKFTNN